MSDRVFYVGRRDPNRVDVVAGHPENDGERLTPRAHHGDGSFEWGYGGSGPADLARSILAHVLGWVPAPGVYQQFKWDVIVDLPSRDGFVLSNERVVAWLVATGWPDRPVCVECSAELPDPDEWACAACRAGVDQVVDGVES